MFLHICEGLSSVCLRVQVTAIDGGLLKFSKLEELVLSANKISEVPTVNLPGTLKASPSPALA